MKNVTFWLCGKLVSVDCSRSAEEKSLRAYVAPAVIEGDLVRTPDAHLRVDESGVEILRGPQLPRRPELSPFGALESVLIRWATALRPSVLLHSGCVIYDGTPILFVAPSGSGKSSMTLAAIRSSSEYVTDDLLILEKGCGFGFARAIRFKDLPVTAVKQTSYLRGMDTQSYLVTIRGEQRAVPLYTGKMQTRHCVDFLQLPPAVVVRVAQGAAPSLRPLSSLDRAIILHEAAITEHQEYDGSLGPGPTYDLVWRDPAESFQMLAGELRRLKVGSL